MLAMFGRPDKGRCCDVKELKWTDLESVCAAVHDGAAGEEWRQDPIHNITEASGDFITLVNTSRHFNLLDFAV